MPDHFRPRTATHSPADRWIGRADRLLRVLAGTRTGTHRPSPANPFPETPLTASERRQVAGLMRVNHTGEVCAQALYAGQASTARLPRIRRSLERAAREEADHLVWCEQRIEELQSRTSLLNPIWYGLSYTLGAAAGMAGDRWSLGFIEETERQVCTHLQGHMQRLPEHEAKSRAILDQMHQEEARHAQMAAHAGARALPPWVKKLMQHTARIMTRTAYHI